MGTLAGITRIAAGILGAIARLASTADDTRAGWDAPAGWEILNRL